MGKLTTLSQEEQDNIIYDARFGDLESLTKIFTDEVESTLLLTTKDEYSLSTPFHMASANGHVEVLKYLISLIEDKTELTKVLNAGNDNGNTALHWAAYNGNLEIVKILCDNGADPFIRNQHNHDAFFEAGNNEQEEVEDYLLQRYGNIVEAEEGEDADAEAGSENKVEFREGTEISKATAEAKDAEKKEAEKEHEKEQEQYKEEDVASKVEKLSI